MQIDESFELPFPQKVVWQAFQNIQLLVDCLPGAQLTSPEGQTPLALSFQIKMGPIAAAFAGQGEVSYDASTYSGRFSGQGTDRKNNSRVKGEARFSMVESAGPVTKVNVSVEFALTGALAQFGRIGIVKEIATSITAEFSSNLQNKLVPADTTVPESQAPAERSLNVGNLFWKMLKLRLLRWLGRA